MMKNIIDFCLFFLQNNRSTGNELLSEKITLKLFFLLKKLLKYYKNSFLRIILADCGNINHVRVFLS